MSLTCEVVEDPGALPGQRWSAVYVGLNEGRQSNHEFDITNLISEAVGRTEGQEVPDAAKKRTDQLRRSNTTADS